MLFGHNCYTMSLRAQRGNRELYKGNLHSSRLPRRSSSQ